MRIDPFPICTLQELTEKIALFPSLYDDIVYNYRDFPLVTVWQCSICAESHICEFEDLETILTCSGPGSLITPWGRKRYGVYASKSGTKVMHQASIMNKYIVNLHEED